MALKKATKKYVTLSVLLFLLLTSGLYVFLHSETLRIWLPCDQLLSFAQTSQQLDDRRDIEKRLQAIDGSIQASARRISKDNCPTGDKAYVEINYSNPFQKNAVQEELARQTFDLTSVVKLSW